MALRSKLIARRKAQKFTQGSLAHELRVDVSTVWRWEKGINPPAPWHRGALAEALGVTLDGLDELLELDPDPESDSDEEDEDPGGGETPVDRGTVERVDRRDLIVGGAALTVGAALGPAQVFASPKDVPPELGAYFADQLAGHNAGQARVGARPLIDTVTSQYRMLRQAADIARPHQRGGLLVVAVGYADLASSLYQEIEEYRQASLWGSETLKLAHQTADPNLVAYALASSSYQHGDAGDQRGSVDLADAALATGGLSPAARVIVTRYAADAYSSVGDRSTVDHLLAECDALLDQDDGDDPFPWGAEHQRMPRYVETRRATCYGRLGAGAEAAELWAEVLDQHPPDARRNAGIYLARYATALFDVDGPQSALAPATEAVDCLQRTPSERMRRELTGLRERAVERQDEAAGRDLVEVLHPVAA